MAKILILNLPLHGHVNPTIALTKELVNRGHDVSYLMNDEFGKMLAPTGANIIIYELPNGKSTSIKNIFDSMTIIYQKALEIGGDYDCLIYEMGFFFGAKVGEELGIKTVCLISTFAFNQKICDDFIRNKGILSIIMKTKVFRMGMSRLLFKDKRLRQADWSYELIDHNPELNIVYTSREFQIQNEDFDEKQFVFVGSSVNGRLQDHNIPFDQMKKKIIYISLGTISTNSLTFYKTCIKAFQNTNVSVIMSIGKRISIKDLGTLPDNFYVYSFVQQVAVLEHVDLFITHCGMNSANEAIYYGVSMLGIPQRADQPIVANRMKELGLGEVIDKKKVTSANLRETAFRIMKNPMYQKKTNEMQQKMLSAGGYIKAVDEIENYIEDKKIHTPHKEEETVK